MNEPTELYAKMAKVIFKVAQLLLLLLIQYNQITNKN